MFAKHIFKLTIVQVTSMQLLCHLQSSVIIKLLMKEGGYRYCQQLPRACKIIFILNLTLATYIVAVTFVRLDVPNHSGTL